MVINTTGVGLKDFKAPGPALGVIGSDMHASACPQWVFTGSLQLQPFADLLQFFPTIGFPPWAWHCNW